MRIVIEAVGHKMEQRTSRFLKDILIAYIDELLLFSKVFEDPIPMINYIERTLVGFIANGICRKDTNNQYSCLTEFPISSNSSDGIADLGIVFKEENRTGYLIELKNLGYEKYSYPILEYDEDDYLNKAELGKEQVFKYEGGWKQLTNNIPSFGVSLVFHNFFANEHKNILEFETEKGRDKVNKKNCNRNISLISNSQDLFYFLVHVEHKKSDGNIENIGLEIFGKIYTLNN